MSITTAFSKRAGLLNVTGDAGGNTIVVSRDAAGTLLVNGKTVEDGGVVATISNTLLINVLGKDGNDVIRLDESNGPLPKASVFAGDGNDVVTGGSGNDLLVGEAGNDTLDGKGGADFLFGGSGNDLLIGGAGTDRMFGGSGDDRFLWNPGDGSDVVEGDSGYDTLEFNGSDGAENFRIAADGSHASLTRDVGNITMDLDGVETISLNARGDTDNIVIGDLSRTDVRSVRVDLSGVPGSGIGDGEADTVAVEGTDRNDRVEIVADGSSVVVSGLSAKVTVDGFEAGHDALFVAGGGGHDTISAAALASGLVHLVVDGGDGNDAITGSRDDDTLHGGSGNDTVIGGGGSDLAFLGDGNDTFIWNPGDGSDQVNGQDGTDTLKFVGSGQNESMVIAGDATGVRLTRDVGNVTMQLDGIERIEVEGRDGADSIVVGDLSATDVREVVIDLGAADGDVDTVTVDGTGSDDRISVTGSGSSVVVRGLSDQVTIRHSEGARDVLTVAGLAGNDVIDASALKPGLVSELRLDGGAGDDDIIGSRGSDVIIGGAGRDDMRGGTGDDTFIWNPGDGSDVIDGQSGADTLVFNGNGAGERFEISAAGDGDVRLLRDLGTVSQDMDGVETIDLDASGGNDTITINDLAGTDVDNVHLRLADNPDGDGGDTVIVNGTSGNDVITLTMENGSLVISGLASRIVIDDFDPASDTLRIAGLGGDDVIDASAIGGDGPQLIFDGGDGNDVLLGSGGNDVLNGDAGDDVLIGGPGVDIVDGGAGDDIEIQDLAAFGQGQPMPGGLDLPFDLGLHLV